MRTPRSFRRDEQGATAIEFGLLAVPFFLVLFAIMEIGLLFLATVNIENAADRIGREIMTGNLAREPAALRSALCNEIQVPVTCGDLLIDYREVPSFDHVPAPIGVAGGRVDSSAFEHVLMDDPSIASLRVAYPWPIVINSLKGFFSDLEGGRRLLISSVLLRMESRS